MPRSAIVVGGTGPTGPGTVNGLLARGVDVTILHSGLHETTFDREVEHIHTDAHSLEAMETELAGRTFDVGIAMYGRLRHVATALARRVGQLIAVGGVFYEGWINDQFHTTPNGEIAETPRPPYTFPPVPMPEDAPMDTNPDNGFARRALASERLVMDLHARGVVSATMLRFPKVYGPGAIAPIEWSVVRRALDRRPAMIVPDGGLVQETKVHAANASAAVLAVVDHPDEAAGETVNVGDDRPVTTREWITILASALDHRFDLVSLPFDVAAPSFPYARDPWTICHHVLDLTKLRTRLRWRPVVGVEDGLAATAHHLAAHPLETGGEQERQAGDPFDYEWEDEFLEAARALRSRLEALPEPAFRYRHPYRHPTEVAT
ncbi:MAG TPA: NAD-dependent epimerase/dehydratase family protein [Acidimicrobiales bacterium]|nr:NAD-dependent epimerase/dehydratase family protein [Acidimicrobiales bacterium]